MVVEDRIDGVKRLLDKVKTYNRLIIEDILEPATIDDIKGNAKTLCDNVKVEIDNIKAEIGEWS